MRLYRVDDEVSVAVSRTLRDWRKAGLLSSEQEQQLAPDLKTDLRRTGLMLRLGLALFTVIAGIAAIGLVFLVSDMRSEVAVSIAAAVLGVAACGAAVVAARDGRFYRHGVEEALAVGGIGLFGFAAGLLATKVFRTSSGSEAWLFGMAAVALASLWAYRRFGFQYAAVGAVCAAALLPIGFNTIGVETKRAFAALVCAGAWAYASAERRRAQDDIAQADAEIVRAASAAGAYLALNIHILTEPFGRHAAPWFVWASWGITWLLPFAVGRVAILQRDPLLLRVAMAAGLATLLTNKSYLGWARQAWDPMLLGVLLAGVALALRRWLSMAADEERNGFTARPLLESDAATIQLVSLASVAAQPTPVRHPHEPTGSTFSGGRSGGGGAGGEF